MSEGCGDLTTAVMSSAHRSIRYQLGGHLVNSAPPLRKSLSKLRLKQPTQQPTIRGIENLGQQAISGLTAMIQAVGVEHVTEDPFYRQEAWKSPAINIADCQQISCRFSVQWTMGFPWTTDVGHYHIGDDGKMAFVTWKKA